MKKFVIPSLLLLLLLLSSCEDNDDNAVPRSLEIKDFIWKGMNLYYLWQTDVPCYL